MYGTGKKNLYFNIGDESDTVTNLPRCQITQEENKCSYPARQRPTKDK